METADPVASEEQDLYEEKVRATFQETLGLIHIALVTHYGLQEGEAVEMEKDLYIWFLRFCIRRDKPPRESRSFLLVACCQFAREYQKYVIGAGVRESDDKLSKLLDREPADVARGFSPSLELLNFRHQNA